MTSKGEIFVEGFLIKKGHMRHNWKIRWFKLSENSLRYYKSQKHSVPHGRIPLKNAILMTSDALSSSDAGDKSRQFVFKVTTENGVAYPIQASSESEYKIWTKAIQMVIDKVDYNRMSPLEKLTEGFMNNNNKERGSRESLDAHHHAEIFEKMKTPEDGVQMEARTINGVRHTRGFSGTELQRWLWSNTGTTGEAAENTVKRLLRIGLIDCITSSHSQDNPFFEDHYYTLLADESSLKAMSTTYIGNLSSPCLNEATSSKAENRSRATKSSANSGLPSDLPPGDVLKKGILFKRGHIVPSWKPRCFVLQEFPATLSYFDPAKKNPKTISTLSLCGATVFSVGKIAAEVALQITNPPEHLFCVKLASGTLYLAIAASEEEKDEWIRAIKSMCRRKI